MVRLEDIPNDLNGDVLRRMRSGGDSLTLSRDIDFSVIFPSEEAAITFCEAVDEPSLKLRYRLSEVDDDCPWGVTVTKDMIPDHAKIAAMEYWLAGHAEPLDGENDGWGCFSQEDLPKG
jgi:hypothetical protein